MPTAFGPNDDVGSDSIETASGCAGTSRTISTNPNSEKESSRASFGTRKPNWPYHPTEAFFGLTVDAGVALHPAHLDAGADHLLRKLVAAEFTSHGEALQLGEAGEVANAEAGGRLLPDIAEQVGRRKIIAVEFFAVSGSAARPCRPRCGRRRPATILPSSVRR